jgi:hypothetical protein
MMRKLGNKQKDEELVYFYHNFLLLARLIHEINRSNYIALFLTQMASLFQT